MCGTTPCGAILAGFLKRPFFAQCWLVWLQTTREGGDRRLEYVVACPTWHLVFIARFHICVDVIANCVHVTRYTICPIVTYVSNSSTSRSVWTFVTSLLDDTGDGWRPVAHCLSFPSLRFTLLLMYNIASAKELDTWSIVFWAKAVSAYQKYDPWLHEFY